MSQKSRWIILGVVALFLVLTLLLLARFCWDKKPQPLVQTAAPAPMFVRVDSPGLPALKSDDAESEGQDQEAEHKQNLKLFFGEDNREFVPAPYPGPYAAIGKMETVNGDRCTATLVTPDLAVTAAHCFFMNKGRMEAGKWFWTGYRAGQWQGRYRVVDQIVDQRFHKGLQYKGDDVYILPKVSHWDIAWLRLEFVDGQRPQPMPLYSGKNADALLALIQQQDSKVTQAGFAYDHHEYLTTHRGCQVNSVVEDNTLEHRCDTLAGDSGSPLWLQTQKGPVLIAVQSAAPDWFNRDKADNTAVTVLQLPKLPKAR